MRNKKSILFVRPDYHCSFVYRDELRKVGWKADIFVNPDYPSKLLYSKIDIRGVRLFCFERFKVVRIINQLLVSIWYLLNFWRYEYHLYYGRSPVFFRFGDRLNLRRFFGQDFVLELSLARYFGVKIIYLPTGCNEDESKEYNMSLDGGNLCNNCGSWNKCDDKINNINFLRVRKYFNLAIGVGTVDSKQFVMSHMKYKSIDMELWSNHAPVPVEHLLPSSGKIRILHSAVLNDVGRNWQNRNVKGSPFVLAAIECLKLEGYPVEYYFIENKPSNQMRFYQVQADIVVEQLLYGWWGSTGVETMALGKPVVCYLRPSWKAFFLKKFPEYDALPIVEADTSTIYEVLKELVTDIDYRHRKGHESRLFAEMHFNPAKNTMALIKTLEAI